MIGIRSTARGGGPIHRNLQLDGCRAAGKDLDAALGRAHITVNKNAVPNDPQSPFVTSGIRIGTPSITTRGMKEAESRHIGGWICDIIDNMGDESVIDRVRGQVAELCRAFPMYAR